MAEREKRLFQLHGVHWQEYGRSPKGMRVLMKQKFFKTEKARERFMDKLKVKTGFIRINCLI